MDRSQAMAGNWNAFKDARLLKLKRQGRSFSVVARALSVSLGAATGRYYRLIGVKHPSRAAEVKRVSEARAARRFSKKQRQHVVAILAATKIHKGDDFRAVVDEARSAGTSFELIGVCLGISKQAVHKRYRRS
jgi:hypothetical protein